VGSAAWGRLAWVTLVAVPLFASVPAHADDRRTSLSRPSVAAANNRAPVDYRISGYRPQPLPPEALPGSANSAPSLNASQSRPIDTSGVALWHYKGRLIYHPLVIGRYGLDLLNGYRVTRNPAYLDRAIANASFLINTAVSRRGALYFPYRFTYPLFGKRSDLMRAPWYSALAQGTALTLFVRLHAITGDRRWRTAADSTFATFVQRRRTKRPWIVFVQRRNTRRYLWFEGYAKNPPTQPLSAHISALFGIYEYTRATRSAAAARIFDGGATTVRYQAPRFRARGGISYYSLRVRAQYRTYHCIHIGQLKLLGRMTGDSRFAREARRFTADAPRAANC
jgi:hypothetical protein